MVDELAAGDRCEPLENLADAVTGLERVAQTLVGVHSVVVSATDPLDVEIPTLFEVAENALHGTLGDADETSDVSLAEVGVPEQGEQDVAVVREEGPSTAERVV